MKRVFALSLLLLAPVAPAAAAPADASCVYLAVGCYAPPLPAPNFPDALVPPIPVPAALGPALGAPAPVPPPPADLFEPAPHRVKHHRRRHRAA